MPYKLHTTSVIRDIVRSARCRLAKSNIKPTRDEIPFDLDRGGRNYYPLRQAVVDPKQHVGRPRT